VGRVEGKVALVTGAARGQGRAHAVGLAREGADIVAVDICAPVEAVSYPLATDSDLAETAALVEKEGARIVTRTADVRDRDALQAAVDDGISELGEIEIVVANAGIWAVAVDEPTDTARRVRVWRDTIDINLTGVWNTIECVVPRMVDAGNGGAMVLTCSTQGLKGAANNDLSLTAYTAAKHGLVGLMRATAIDLAPHSIRVNTVHPTGVQTPMVENEIVGAYAAKHPRLGELTANPMPVASVAPQDITNAILFLVSDEGKFITGVTLPVDAGYLL
jgi:SDR family mycofactocin-dependent oxidoreductase